MAGMSHADLLAARYGERARRPQRKPKRMRWPNVSPPEFPGDARRRQLALHRAVQLAIGGTPLSQACSAAVIEHVQHRFGRAEDLVDLAMRLYPLVVTEIQRRSERRRYRGPYDLPDLSDLDLPTMPAPQAPSSIRPAIAVVLERQTDRGIRAVGRAPVSRCKCSHGRDSHLFRPGSSPCTWSDCGCELFRPASLRSDDVS